MPKKWVGSREEAATTSLINGSVRLLLATRVEEAGDNGGAATHASQKDCVGMKHVQSQLENRASAHQVVLDKIVLTNWRRKQENLKRQKDEYPLLFTQNTT